MVRLSEPGQPAEHGSGAIRRPRLRLPVLRVTRTRRVAQTSGTPSRSRDQDVGDPYAVDVPGLQGRPIDKRGSTRWWSPSPSSPSGVRRRRWVCLREGASCRQNPGDDWRAARASRTTIRGRPRRHTDHRISGFRDPKPSTTSRARPLWGRRGRRCAAQSATAAGFCCYPLLVSDEWLDPVRSWPEFADVLAQVKREHELAAAAFAAAGGDRILDVR